jgi:hypothetical protein
MAEIRESRTIRVKDCIITSHDLQKLAGVLWSEFLCHSVEDKRPEIAYTVICNDDSVFHSENISLFGEESIVGSNWLPVSGWIMLGIKLAHTLKLN